MDKKMKWDRLAEYFAGELTEKEEQKMELWITSDPKREQKIEQLRRMWDESSVPPQSLSELDVDEAWNRLSGDMDKLDMERKVAGRIPSQSQPGAFDSSRRHYSKAEKIKRRVLIAAAAAVVIIAGFWGYQNFTQLHAVEGESTEIATRELKAQKGERATYVLSDGSRVMLHAESSLEVPVRFTGDTRKVHLKGEAYFEVAEDAEQPFIIQSGEAYTRVLGTKFIVQAWPDQSQTEVVVAEGKVAFGKSTSAHTSEKEEVILTDNQKGVLDSNQILAAADVQDIDWYMGWTTGKLVFENRPLNEVIPKLERWYALDIHLEDEGIGNEKLSAEIDYTQPMDEVLGGIALSLELEMDRKGRTVTYTRK